MTVSKTTFNPAEQMALEEFIGEYVEVCKENGIPRAKRQAKTVLAYVANPFDPSLLAEIDVFLCWDVLSTMERDKFLDGLFAHFGFLLLRQAMLD